MEFKFIRILIVILFYSSFKAQDNLYFKNGTIKEVEVVKWDFNWIYYKLKDNPSPYVYKESIDEVLMIKYQNNTEYLPNKRLKFSFSFDFNLFANHGNAYYYQEPSRLRGKYINYPQYNYRYDSVFYYPGFNSGINFLIGRRTESKFLFSFMYTRAKGEYSREVRSFNTNGPPYHYFYKYELISAIRHMFTYRFGFHLRCSKFLFIDFGKVFHHTFAVYGSSNGYEYTSVSIPPINYFASTTIDISTSNYRSIDLLNMWNNFLQFEIKTKFLKSTLSFTTGINFKFFFDRTHSNNISIGIRYAPIKLHNLQFKPIKAYL